MKTRTIRLTAVISALSVSAFQLSSCSTTKDTIGNTTTTLTASGDAAVAAAVQIANAAAQAAIQTYLTNAPQTKARLARSVNAPAINAAKRATESEIEKALPDLSARKIHSIVERAYATALAGK
jgi:hypothetical protein